MGGQDFETCFDKELGEGKTCAENKRFALDALDKCAEANEANGENCMEEGEAAEMCVERLCKEEEEEEEEEEEADDGACEAEGKVLFTCMGQDFETSFKKELGEGETCAEIVDALGKFAEANEANSQNCMEEGEAAEMCVKHLCAENIVQIV